MSKTSRSIFFSNLVGRYPRVVNIVSHRLSETNSNVRGLRVVLLLHGFFYNSKKNRGQMSLERGSNLYFNLNYVSKVLVNRLIYFIQTPWGNGPKGKKLCHADSKIGKFTDNKNVNCYQNVSLTLEVRSTVISSKVKWIWYSKCSVQ